MFKFLRTPFDLAWDIWRGKKPITDDGRAVVFGCPDCEMPIDEGSQKTNVRIETIEEVPHYLLSCPWCYHVYNIGKVADVDTKFVIAKKEVVV